MQKQSPKYIHAKQFQLKAGIKLIQYTGIYIFCFIYM